VAVFDCGSKQFGLLLKRSTSRDLIGGGFSVADFAIMSAGHHKIIGNHLNGDETVGRN